MSLTLNNIIRRIIALSLTLVLCFGLSACKERNKDIRETDQICVSGALYESWMYVLTDADFVDEMVTIFSSIKYKKTDTPVDMMTTGECLSLTFSKGNETLNKYYVDKSGNFSFEAGGQVYTIVSDFDFKIVRSLVDEQINNLTNADLATPDEV